MEPVNMGPFITLAGILVEPQEAPPQGASHLLSTPEGSGVWLRAEGQVREQLDASLGALVIVGGAPEAVGEGYPVVTVQEVEQVMPAAQPPIGAGATPDLTPETAPPGLVPEQAPPAFVPEMATPGVEPEQAPSPVDRGEPGFPAAAEDITSGLGEYELDRLDAGQAAARVLEAEAARQWAGYPGFVFTPESFMYGPGVATEYALPALYGAYGGLAAVAPGTFSKAGSALTAGGSPEEWLATAAEMINDWLA